MPYGTGVDFNAIAVGEGSINVGEAIRNAGVTATPEPPFVPDTAVVRPEQTATPTPALPEEGGPAGGVISGRVYRDQDDSGAFSDADESQSERIISVIWDQSGGQTRRDTTTDATGRWEIRGLDDRTYSVQFVLDSPGERDGTIPPAQRIAQTYEDIYDLPPLYGITFNIEIKDASRVTDVNFGLPRRGPIAGVGGITTPNAGSGSGSSEIAAWALAGAMALSVVGAGLFAVARRRAR